MSKISDASLELIEAAKQARGHAYAPYSKFKVGVALRLKDGRIITGINLENCSYGLTVCAERNAIASAVGAGAQSGDFVELAIVVEAEEAASPCGACRQVIAEFCTGDTRVVLHNIRHSQTIVTSVEELLPRAFLPNTLKRALDPPAD